MASGDALPIPRKNVAYRVYFPILDNDGDLVTGATALDSEISKDGGTFADVTAEATEIATNSGMYFLDLTAAEMNADCVVIIVKTTSTDAKTTPIVLYPEEAGDIRVNITEWLGATVNALASGRVDTKVGDMGGNVLDSVALDTSAAAEIAARIWDTAKASHVAAGSFGEEVQSHSTHGDPAADIATVDTVVDAIKAVTDLLPNAGALSDLATILADTNELQGDWVNTGRLDAILDAIKAVTDNLPNSGALTNLDAAISSRSSHGDPDPSGFLDATVSSRSSHGDPDPSGFIDVAISSRAVTGAAMALTAAAIDAIWDEVMSGHATAGSFGERFNIIRNGTAQGGGSNTITLDASASSVDDFYNNTIVHLVGGTGTGQTRFISDYDGTTKVATVNENWITDPDSSSVFLVLPFGSIPGASAPSATTIADAVLNRPISNVEPSAGFRTLYGAVASLVNRSRINALNQLEIYKVDDTTLLVTIPGTVDATLLPIKELNPP